MEGSPDYVVYAGRDWVACLDERQALEAQVKQMLRGRDRVVVWSGEKAAQAFPPAQPQPLPTGPTQASFFFAYGSLTYSEVSVVDALERAWRDGADEVLFLTSLGREEYLAEQGQRWQAEEDARYRVHPPGRRGRISPLAERLSR
jgi:hypothetical protein